MYVSTSVPAYELQQILTDKTSDTKMKNDLRKFC